MYGSAVMYPLSLIKEKVAEGSISNFAGMLIEYNPMTVIIELFRYITLGVGNFSMYKMSFAFVFSIIIFLLGLVVFNKTEKSFIDTI